MSMRVRGCGYGNGYNCGNVVGNVWNDLLAEVMRAMARKHGHRQIAPDGLKRECDRKFRQVLGL